MTITCGFQNVDCIVRHFLLGLVCTIKLNLKLIYATDTVWVLMPHRPVLIPISANDYEQLSKIPKIFLP